MATRGAIVRVKGDGFEGVYHHWDSYPTGLGLTLANRYHDAFDADLDKMLEYLIDDHPAGWSTINGKDFNKSPGFIEYGSPAKKNPWDDDFVEPGPECYCHGDGSEEGWVVTDENASGSGCEYVYAFDRLGGRDVMHILTSYTEVDGEDVKMIGFFGCGDEGATWRPLATVFLDNLTLTDGSPFNETTAEEIYQAQFV